MVMKLTPQARSVYGVQEYGAGQAIEGVGTIDLRRFRDDGGSMVELLRFAETRPAGLEGFEPAQINYSTIQPGSIKAFHVHLRQTDVWFVPPEDRVLLVLVDVREGVSTSGRHVRTLLGDGRAELVRIPPGVAHGCRNLGRRPARVIYFSDLAFSPDPEQCDEGRLPWDFVGAEVWEVARE
jgi:dTDP-4-dehydrorhamnose 3,5-epimerase